MTARKPKTPPYDAKHRAEDGNPRHSGNPRQPNEDGMYPHGGRAAQARQYDEVEDRGNNDPHVR